MRKQHGQSLVEFAAGAAVLLLLLLGVITLSGYQEVQRRSSIAARQFAYESAWQFMAAVPREAAARVYRQHFDDPGLLDAVGRAHYLSSDSVQVSRQRSFAPGLAGDAASLLLVPLQTGSSLTGQDLDLDAGGYFSGEVIARLVPTEWTPSPFRNLDIVLRQPYAILSDPWNSGNPSQVRDRTASLVPTQRMASLASIWQALAAPLSIFEPSISKLCLGLIEPDTVPEDRLGPRMPSGSRGRVCQ